MTNKCKRGILISKTPYEKRFAIMEDGELAELVVEGMSTDQILGNIYKGVVKKVVSGSKLAYVDIGLGVDGVLYQDDVVDRKTSLNRNFNDDDDKAFDNAAIEKVLREGDEIMVQVTKEPAGNKGAVLTMRLLFAGSLLVCMPGTNFIGVSKRERDQAKRSELKRLINRLKAGDSQRYGKVAHVREGVTKQPQTKKCVRETIDEVTRDEKSLARQAVHNWRDGQRHEDVRNKLYCHDKRRGQGGTRLVKNEERERKAAGNATSSADDRSKGNKREVARPKRGAIVVHGKTSRKKAPSSELGQKQSVV